MTEAVVTRFILQRASAAARGVHAHLRALGLPVRVILAPDSVQLVIPEAAALELDFDHPTIRAARGLPVRLCS